ncbi:preprotein translocase subunit SecA [Thalassospira sp. MA62]|nr:preprotein translocase subunit SecA [Thalassospira sp. MA62]
MLGAIARKIFGSANDREVKALRATVEQVNALEPEIEKLSDDELRARTDWLRDRLKKGETLGDITADAFATIREAAKRVRGERHYDVQLMGGMVLCQGKIAEMKTGEGKTLVSTLPVYLNALEGKGVHVVTVNDYLASRDAEWMGEVYNFLGLTVGVIMHGMTDDQRRIAYGCDVTYATNNELGFDYLRDNMKFRLEDMVQRPFNFAIVDEVDSILIDEARTPLIISGPAEDSSELYRAIDALIPRLVEEDYEKDEKARAVTLTEDGTEHAEQLLMEMEILTEGTLYDVANVHLVHHVNQALRAHKLFQKDTDYIVKDDKVIIIDEFTGRMMEGRRYSDGLHQALEAKEKVKIQNENQTLASITFQNYFRLYPTLSGMTGTAMTEAEEFEEIYNLQVVEIPTHRPIARVDADDEIYRTANEKWVAISEQLEDCHKRGQPALVGTVSIEKSEILSDLLKKKKVPHEVLNAKQHEREALIVAQAGAPGAITIATNMAGRGTDIKLGGNVEMRVEHELANVTDEAKRASAIEKIKEEVKADQEKVLAAGGLFVIGTERHESRRVDNQLRGRSGRQGDPGASKFYLSLEDDLMRIFGSERMDGMLQKLGLKEGEAIYHPWINKALEKAQQKVEARNFDTRKNVLKFDDVMNDQRKVVYEQRRDLMQAENVAEDVADMRAEVIEGLVETYCPAKVYPEQWEAKSLHEEAQRLLGVDLPISDWIKEEGIDQEVMRDRLSQAADQKMAAKVANYGADIMRQVEKSLVLQLLDQTWKEHLLALDHLRQGIGLRAYGQRDPLNEFKREAFNMFEGMLGTLRERVTQMLSHVELQSTPRAEDLEPKGASQEMHENRAELENAGTGAISDDQGQDTATVQSRQAAGNIDPNDPATWGRVARNQLCPCGSGKKYKHCHGQLN